MSYAWADLDYCPFNSIAALVIGVMVGGLLQAGMTAAREWERQAIPELLLSPAPRSAMALGRMLSRRRWRAWWQVASLAFVTLVIGDWPVSWGEVLAFTVLASCLFVAAGTWLGTMAYAASRHFTLLVRGCSVPLFFLSGIFAPISFSTPGVQLLGAPVPDPLSAGPRTTRVFGLHLNTLRV